MLTAELSAERLLVRRGLKLIQNDFQERTWQAFWLVVMEGQSAPDVARQLGITLAAVHQARQRVFHRLRETLGESLESFVKRAANLCARGTQRSRRDVRVQGLDTLVRGGQLRRNVEVRPRIAPRCAVLLAGEVDLDVDRNPLQGCQRAEADRRAETAGDRDPREHFRSSCRRTLIPR